MTMTHSAIDTGALDRLRRQFGSVPAGASDTTGASDAEPQGLSASAPSSLAGRARQATRRLAAPLVDRARAELARAAAHENAALRAEVADVRAELVRTRTTQAAELAALHEELRNR